MLLPSIQSSSRNQPRYEQLGNEMSATWGRLMSDLTQDGSSVKQANDEYVRQFTGIIRPYLDQFVDQFSRMATVQGEEQQQWRQIFDAPNTDKKAAA